MTAPATPSTAPRMTPARDIVFGGFTAHEGLQPFLSVRPPPASDQTPPVLSFRRKRRVDLPWQDILSNSATAGETSIASIREYFEASWGVAAVDKTTLGAVVEGDAARIVALQTAGRDAKGNPAPKPMYRASLDAPAAAESDRPAAVTVDSGLIIQHGTSGRWYLMVSHGGEPLSQHDVASVKAYETLWRDKIDGVELVFDNAEAAKGGFTRFSEVDLRPRVIHRAFNELLIHKDFVDTVSKSAAEATRNAVEKITSTTLDFEELQRLQEKSFQLQIQAYEAQRRLDRLVSQAGDLGYYLFLEKKSFAFPGGKATPVEPGEIYTQYRRTATWVTTHHRNVTQSTGWWIFKGSKTVRQAYTQSNATIVTDYRKVDTTRDPLVEAVASHRAQGKAVFVFEQGPIGFVTSDGTPLREVMGQCERNESFRERCVVMLPVYEESLTGQRVLSKYSVFERPLPGISPSALPQFSLLESLSYRTAWLESQLGEVVSSINLSPGEERTVVLTKVFEQESSVTRSSTSIFDISRTDSSDLASEMENQARQESEQSSNMNFSATARGSYGLFSAEASASGGSSTSLKSFSHAISKVARKASQSVNQKNREEVSTSSTTKTTVSNKDETSATIRNINQGRTLNLLFHRLNNKFRGGIYLDDLQFEVIPSTEIIAGSGVYESLRYTLDEMPELLEQFQQTRLPFDIVPDDPARSSFLAQVVASLKVLLEMEYMGANGSAPQPAARGAARAADRPAAPQTDRTSVARMSLGPAPDRPTPAKAPRGTRGPAVANRAADGALGAVHGELGDFVARLKYATIDRDTSILGDELILASGGLYLDAVVGAQASTEPYSEEMRAQEIRMRDAEVRKSLAEAEYQRALAASLSGNGAAHGDGNSIVGVRADAAHRTLHVLLREPVAAGEWNLMLDGSRIATSRAGSDGQKGLLYRWRQAQDWLDADDLTSRIALEERATQQRVEFIH
jgi:hypothetical protein